MIRCRNSGGYGGRLLGIVDSSSHRGTMSTEAGQLHKITYDVTLYEREGKQALQLTSGLPTGGRVVIDLTRA